MKNLEIDNYLAEIVVAIDDLGGRVCAENLISRPPVRESAKVAQ